LRQVKDRQPPDCPARKCTSDLVTYARREVFCTRETDSTTMDLAAIILSIAVPVAIVLSALFIQSPLSEYIWHEFLKVSKPATSKPNAEQEKEPPQSKRTEHGPGAEG
jgi:hypothetical protein